MTTLALRPITPVDLYVGAYRLSGVSRQVDETHRLTDLLNNVEETFFLRNVAISTAAGELLQRVDELTVEKRAIVAAVPRETADLLAQRRVQRAGMPRPPQTPVQVVVLTPPYLIAGIAHVTLQNERSPVELRNLPRFFAMTEARVSLDDEEVFEGAVLLVNRDAVAVLGRSHRDVDSFYATDARIDAGDEVA
jgi:hypothetical protein